MADMWLPGNRLRARRTELALTQAQVCQRLRTQGVVVSIGTLSSLERGRGIDAGRLPALAHALECTVTYLVGLTDDPTAWDPDQAEPAPHRPVRRAVPDDAQRNWILGPLDDIASS